MTKRALLWAFTFVWLLGPIEPVFAFDRDIAGQFPDVVTAPGGGNVWAVETTPQSRQGRNDFGGNSISQGNNQPWTVETWSRGKRRYKHFNGGNGGNGGFGVNGGFGGNGGNAASNFNSFNGGNDPDISGGPRAFRRQRRFSADNNYGASNNFNSGDSRVGWSSNNTYVPRAFNYNDVAASPQQYFPDRDIQPGQPVRLTPPVPPPSDFAGRITKSAGNSLISAPDPNAPRRLDKFADTPQVDDSGIRRFSNGRHHDLSSKPMQQALAETEASDAQLQQQQRDQLMQRLRARPRINQLRNMFGNF